MNELYLTPGFVGWKPKSEWGDLLKDSHYAISLSENYREGIQIQTQNDCFTVFVDANKAELSVVDEEMPSSLPFSEYISRKLPGFTPVLCSVVVEQFL